MTFGEMTDADKIMNPNVGNDPADNSRAYPNLDSCGNPYSNSGSFLVDIRRLCEDLSTV